MRCSIYTDKVKILTGNLEKIQVSSERWKKMRLLADKRSGHASADQGGKEKRGWPQFIGHTCITKRA